MSVTTERLSGSADQHPDDDTSSVTATWASQIQTHMPAEVASSGAWQHALAQLPTIQAGTAESRRIAVIRDWMWDGLLRAQTVATRAGLGDQWAVMTTTRHRVEIAVAAGAATAMRNATFDIAQSMAYECLADAARATSRVVASQEATERMRTLSRRAAGRDEAKAATLAHIADRKGPLTVIHAVNAKCYATRAVLRSRRTSEEDITEAWLHLVEPVQLLRSLADLNDRPTSTHSGGTT